jgi:hypothetical protein
LHAVFLAISNHPTIFSDHGKTSPPGLTPANPLSALEMTRLALFKMYNQVTILHAYDVSMKAKRVLGQIFVSKLCTKFHLCTNYIPIGKKVSQKITDQTLRLNGPT